MQRKYYKATMKLWRVLGQGASSFGKRFSPEKAAAVEGVPSNAVVCQSKRDRFHWGKPPCSPQVMSSIPHTHQAILTALDGDTASLGPILTASCRDTALLRPILTDLYWDVALLRPPYWGTPTVPRKNRATTGVLEHFRPRHILPAGLVTDGIHTRVFATSQLWGGRSG